MNKPSQVIPKSTSLSSVPKDEKRRGHSEMDKAKFCMSSTSAFEEVGRQRKQRRKTYGMLNSRIKSNHNYCQHNDSSSESGNDVCNNLASFAKYSKTQLIGINGDHIPERDVCKKVPAKFHGKISHSPSLNENPEKLSPELLVVHAYPLWLPNIRAYLGYEQEPTSTLHCQDASCQAVNGGSLPVIAQVKTAKRNWLTQPKGKDVVIRVNVQDKYFFIKRSTLVRHSLVFRKALLSNDPLPVGCTLNYIASDEFEVIKDWMKGKEDVVNKHNAAAILEVARKLEMPELFTQCRSLMRTTAGEDEKTTFSKEAEKQRKKEEKEKEKQRKKEEKEERKSAEKEEKKRAKEEKKERPPTRESSEVTVSRVRKKLDEPTASTETTGYEYDEAESEKSEPSEESEETEEIKKTSEKTSKETSKQKTESKQETEKSKSASKEEKSKTKTVSKEEEKSKSKTPSKEEEKSKSKTPSKDETKEESKEETKEESEEEKESKKSEKEEKESKKSEKEDEEYWKKRCKDPANTVVWSIDPGCVVHYEMLEGKRKEYEDRLKKEQKGSKPPKKRPDKQHLPLQCAPPLRPLRVCRTKPDPPKPPEKSPHDDQAVPEGMLRLSNGRTSVLVNIESVMSESRRLKKLLGENEEDDDVRPTSINISKVTEEQLRELAAWFSGDTIILTIHNVNEIVALAERLDMPVLRHKSRRYQLDVDEGCRTPREVYPDDWIRAQIESRELEQQAAAEEEEEAAISDCVAEDLPFQNVGAEEENKEPEKEKTTGCEQATAASQTSSSQSSSADSNSTPEEYEHKKEKNEGFLAQMFGSKKKEKLCGMLSCKRGNQKLLKSSQLLFCQDTVVLGESYCGGNELDQTCYASEDTLKFPFDAQKYHWVIDNPAFCHAFCAAVVYKGKLYVSGGRNVHSEAHCNSSAVSHVWCFNRNENCWRQICSMNFCRIHHTAVVFQDSIVFLGGLDDKLHTLSAVERLCIKKNQTNLSQVAPMSIARAGVAANAHGNILFVAGGISNQTSGCNGCHILDTIECYDGEVDKWHRLTPLGIPRAFATMISTSRGLYLIGGVTPTNKIDPTLESIVSVANVDIYGSQNNEKSQGLNMPRYAASAAVHSGHLYVFGGIELETGSYVSVVERYSASNCTWVLANDKFSQQLKQH